MQYVFFGKKVYAGKFEEFSRLLVLKVTLQDYF